MDMVVHGTQAITARAVPGDSPKLAAIKKSARDFEAMFVGQMLQPMFDGLSTSGPFGGGQSEEAFRGLLIGEYAKEITARAPLGIADHMVRTLIQNQVTEAALSKPAAPTAKPEEPTP
jgi:Rod binding domain-containing protein